MLAITFGLLICLASLSHEVRIPPLLLPNIGGNTRRNLPTAPLPRDRGGSVSLPSVSLDFTQGPSSTANAENLLERRILPTAPLPRVSVPSVSVPSVSLEFTKGPSSTANAENLLERRILPTAPLPRVRGPSVGVPSVSLEFTQGPSSTANAENLLEQEWTDFKERYNKVYSSLQEEAYRKEVFLENREKIIQFNHEYARGLRNFASRINTYADKLHHEFTLQFNGFNRSRPDGARSAAPRNFASTFIPSANVLLPESVDWKMAGAVSPVKNQGQCASCYAFAAAGALESHWFRKTGELVDVSEQNLIDCTEPHGNFGCNGGLMNPAFEYVKENDGVDSETSYPYEEKTGQCRFTPENIVAKCTGYVDITSGNEDALEHAVATVGPVTAAIDGGRPTMQFYSGGIYDDPTCGSQPGQLNHAVLIVGYGQEADGRKYFLVKNSYGDEWGLGGYIKIAKNNGNQCGIAVQASYPLV